MIIRKNKLLVLMLLLATCGIGVLQYYLHNKLYSEQHRSVLKDGTEMVVKFFWDKNNNLVEWVTEFKNKDDRQKNTTNILRFKKGSLIVVDGYEYLRQEPDFSKTKTLSKKHPAKYFIYSKDRTLAFSEIDMWGDGKNIGKTYYKDNIISKVITSNKKDGKFDVWTYYENGNPVRSEYDSNGDGKPDTKGIPPPDKKSIVGYKMGNAR